MDFSATAGTSDLERVPSPPLWPPRPWPPAHDALERLSPTATAAFAHLVAASQHANVKRRVIAGRMVQIGEGPHDVLA